MELIGYPNVCTGSVMYGWQSSKQNCIRLFYATLGKHYGTKGRGWEKDGFMSAVTNSAEEEGAKALKEIGFICVNDKVPFCTRRHRTVTKLWWIRTTDLVKWYHNYRKLEKEILKEYKEQAKLQKEIVATMKKNLKVLQENV